MWPTAERPAHLLGDRAFPSGPLLLLLRQVGWGWTLRLWANHGVTVAGQGQAVRALLASAPPRRWSARGAQYGRGARALSGTLVIGQGLVVLPWHQRGPGSQRHRAARHKERQRHLLTKHPERRAPTTARETDAWVVLFSSHRTWLAAVRSDGRRWATEGSDRDAQGGWDGRHGWELEAALVPLTDPVRVERLVGLWALGALVQTWLGHCLGQPAIPTGVQAVRREWTTTGRLSVWARGRFALTEPSEALRPWILDTLARGARHVAAGALTPATWPRLVHVAPPEAA